MMLSGIRVLEFGQNVAGPYGASILCDLGAEVIKIEKPGGEDGRKLGPPFSGADPAWFHQVNRGKKSVIIDIKNENGRARLLRLMSTADVFLHNTRPGSLEKLGLGPETITALYPKLVYVDARAFGHVGPLADDPGYELLMQASSGLMSITGSEDAPPTRAGPSIVDLTTGMWIAIGALAAIIGRSNSGQGAIVNTSLYESALALSAIHIANFSVSGKMPPRTANGFAGLAPYGAFKTRDAEIIVGAGNDGLFGKLSKLLGHPEWIGDPDFATNVARVANKTRLNALIHEALTLEDARTWLSRLKLAGIPSAPIMTIPEVIQAPQTRALGVLCEGNEDASLLLMRSPLSFDGMRPEIDQGIPSPGENDGAFP